LAPEKVRFETVDQAELVGTFYPSSRGKKAFSVLLLHPLGEDSQKPGWEDLAVTLQKNGFAVLRFDFRGHGESTGVGPDFWRVGYNRTLKSFRPFRPPDQISQKDFTTLAHYLMLVNDIAAARRFLDRKNDTGECNSANVLVIGAEDGATLGALWIATEWRRRHAPSWSLGMTAPGATAGQDIAGAVWLGIRPTLGRWRVPVDHWLRSPVREKVPMYFLYGEEDTRAAQFARSLCDDLLKASRLERTGKKAVPKAETSGMALLEQDALDVKDLILKYLDVVVEDGGAAAWTERDVGRSPFVLVPFEPFLR
jgi:hypothetical protein